MAIKTPAEMATALYVAGFRGEAIPIMIAIAKGESGWNTDVIADKAAGEVGPGYGEEYSVGLWQINLLAHPDVDEACAKDMFCAAAAAFKISGDGTNFNPWTVYSEGKYRQYLPDIVAAVTNTFEDMNAIIDRLTHDQMRDMVRAAPQEVVDKIVGFLPFFMRQAIAAVAGPNVNVILDIVPKEMLREAIRIVDGGVLEAIMLPLKIIPALTNLATDKAKDGIDCLLDPMGCIEDLFKKGDVKRAAITASALILAIGLVLLGGRGMVGNSEALQKVVGTTKRVGAAVATKGLSEVA